ncbi:MAG: hypothetical protein AAB013_07270 [Planctomycetota bacterium]
MENIIVLTHKIVNIKLHLTAIYGCDTMSTSMDMIIMMHVSV